MIYRFTITSDEVDGFLREIKIDSDATFYDLHLAITKCTDFSAKEMASFVICDDNWEKEKEITLEDMGSSSEDDIYLMRDTKLGDLIEDEKQKLRYVFDYMTERAFFIELSEIITGKDINEALCSKSVGMPPKQIMDFDEASLNTDVNHEELDDDFYGSESYNDDDISSDDFNIEEVEGGDDLL